MNEDLANIVATYVKQVGALPAEAQEAHARALLLMLRVTQRHHIKRVAIREAAKEVGFTRADYNLICKHWPDGAIFNFPN